MTDSPAQNIPLSLSDDAIYALLLDVSGQRPDLVRQALTPVYQHDGSSLLPNNLRDLVERVIQARVGPLLIETLPEAMRQNVGSLSAPSDRIFLRSLQYEALVQRVVGEKAVATEAPASRVAESSAAVEAPTFTSNAFDANGVRSGLIDEARRVREEATPDGLRRLGMALGEAWMEFGVPHRTPLSDAYDLGKVVLDTLLESDAIKAMPIQANDEPHFSAFFKGMACNMSPMGYAGMDLRNRLIQHASDVRATFHVGGSSQAGATADVTKSRAPTSGLTSAIPDRNRLWVNTMHRLASRRPLSTSVLTPQEMEALYGPSPTDEAFQALSDRLVALTRNQPVRSNDFGAAATMGQALGTAMLMNDLSYSATLHLLNRMLGEREMVENMPAEAKRVLLHSIAKHSGAAFDDEMREQLLNRVSGTDESRLLDLISGHDEVARGTQPRVR